MVAHPLRLVMLEAGEQHRRAARAGGVEDEAAEAEAALQRPAEDVDMLDPAERHDPVAADEEARGDAQFLLVHPEAPGAVPARRQQDRGDEPVPARHPRHEPERQRRPAHQQCVGGEAEPRQHQGADRAADPKQPQMVGMKRPHPLRHCQALSSLLCA